MILPGIKSTKTKDRADKRRRRHKLARRVSGARNFAPLFLYLLRRFIRAGICFRFGSYTQ